MLDWEGSGAKSKSAIVLEQELDERLARSWGTRAKAIVIEPEVDIWIWGSDNALSNALQWSGRQSIREWLANNAYTFDGNQKPVRPKEALDRLLRHLEQPRSSVLYERTTSKISLAKCVDEAFNRLKLTLQSWFPP
jgi:hypothetical protein